jgi:hypothetical protein
MALTKGCLHCNYRRFQDIRKATITATIGDLKILRKSCISVIMGDFKV